MINREQISLTLPKELLNKIDLERGLIPRSRYFESIISQFLNKRNPAPPKRKTNEPSKENSL